MFQPVGSTEMRPRLGPNSRWFSFRGVARGSRRCVADGGELLMCWLLRMRHDRPSPWTRPSQAILVSLWLVAPLAAHGEMLLVSGSLVAGDAAEDDRLGQAVAVSGDVLVTTAPTLTSAVSGLGRPMSFYATRRPATGSSARSSFRRMGRPTISSSPVTPSPSAPRGPTSPGSVSRVRSMSSSAPPAVRTIGARSPSSPMPASAVRATSAPPLHWGATYSRLVPPKRTTPRAESCCSSATAVVLTPGARSLPSRTPMSGAPAAATAASFPSSAAR